MTQYEVGQLADGFIYHNVDLITSDVTFEKHKQDWDLLAHTKAPITE